MARIFIGQPHNGVLDSDRADAINIATDDRAGVELVTSKVSSSLINWAHNACIAAARNYGDVDYLAILHADVLPSPGWATQLMDDLESSGADIIHAPCNIKDFRGLTSTAVAYSEDPWDHKRRLTVKEIRDLPPVFTGEDVGGILLPNTGCMMMRLTVCPIHFAVLDRIVERDGQFRAETVSEDWMFGYFANDDGLVVACTRNVTTSHYGRIAFESDRPGRWHSDYDYEFGAAWEKADRVEGWLTCDEGSLLYRLACQSGGPIIEIGAYKGRSTTLLAETGLDVLTIDDLSMTYQGDRRPPASRDGTWLCGTKDRLLALEGAYDNVSWHCGASDDVIADPSFGFLYVDGDHRGDRPYLDLVHWLPFATPGAMVAFHDADEVRPCIDRAVSEGLLRPRTQAGSLWVGEVL